MAYPLPVFHFAVEWGPATIAFSEVAGLNIEVQPIEYREGSSPDFSTTKRPGLTKYGNLTLKRGVFAGDNEYFEWIIKNVHNQTERRDIIVKLMNDEHIPVMVWKIRNAWATKLTAPDMKASANEAAIESLEIAHEGITIENNA